MIISVKYFNEEYRMQIAKCKVKEVPTDKIWK